MKAIINSLFLIILLFSSNRPPRDVRMVLKAAGENRAELEKVIDHYKKSGDKEKLMAAYFLIGNMDNKFTIECKESAKYDVIFNIIDSIVKCNKFVLDRSPLLRVEWDSILKKYGTPTMLNTKIIFDYSVISANLLIENIDLSFQMRNESEWGKKISFENFCEFILPYRFNHEPLENWRAFFFNTYRTSLDSINADSIYELALAVNKIVPNVRWFEILKTFPYDIPITKLVKDLMGSCKHVVIYNAAFMRALGIPVGIENAPLLGNFSTGHDWNSLLTENGFIIPFERNGDTLSNNFVHKRAKAFRQTFGRQNLKFSPRKIDVPQNLLDNHRIDVTHEYSNAFDVNIELNKRPFFKRKKYAVICTFNNKDWVPQDFGRIKKGKALFMNMGSDILYHPMYFNNGRLYSTGKPFVLRKDGKVDVIEFSKYKTQEMLLLRKYYFTKKPYSYQMIGGNFWGANKSDLSDSVKLFTITEIPEKIESVNINNSSKFKYVFYSGLETTSGNVAELWFFGGENQSDTLVLKGKIFGYPEIPASSGTTYMNALDGSLETYFDRIDVGKNLVGLDLGVAKRVTKISYCPRSDTNFIIAGDNYELCYLNGDEWISIGKQVAEKQFLIYKDVPSDGLYILHNLSHGKEERCFTYENGQQVFW